MKCIEDYDFNITYDFYKNLIWLKPLNEKYDKVFVNIIDQNNNSIYAQLIDINVNLSYWFQTSSNFTEFESISVIISNINGELITKENIKIKTKTGIIIKPVILKICNKVGLGDQMFLSPSIRKLCNVYGRKVIICSDRENYRWGNYLYSAYKEFLQNNRYVNYFIYSDEIEDASLYDIYEGYPSGEDYVWFNQKKLISLPMNFLLKDDELQLDYIPNKYIPIENLPEKYVCINPYIAGVERTWEKEKWQELVNLLNNNNIYVVSIGKFNYYNLDIKLGLDLAGAPQNMSQTWHIINKSNIFVSYDCSMYILAGTTDSHILLLGWCSDEKYHMPTRENNKFSCVRGDCELRCAFDSNCVFEIFGSLKDNIQISRCYLDIDYKCKPEPIKVFEKIKEYYNGTFL